jgi:hypothetical protein
MLGMGELISLAARRPRTTGFGWPEERETALLGSPTHPVWAEDEPSPPSSGPDRFDDRRALGELEAAFARLESAVTAQNVLGAPLDRQAETELLAVIGELALGYVPEAARRLERLETRLTRRRPVRRTAER